MFLHQFWCTQGILLQTILVVIVGSTDLNPNDQQSTHIQLRAHRLNNNTVCSTVSVGILMRTMVVFGSWSQTLLIWRASFYNSHQEYIVQYLDPHMCSPSYHLGEESHLHWLHNWSSYPLHWILILTSQLVSVDRGIEWFRKERFWVLWQKQRSDKLQPWPKPTCTRRLAWMTKNHHFHSVGTPCEWKMTDDGWRIMDGRGQTAEDERLKTDDRWQSRSGPIRAERWRHEAKRWEHPKMYPPVLYPGLTIQFTLVQ